MTATVRLLARGMIWIEGPRRLYRLQLTRGRNGDEKSNFRAERNLSNKTRENRLKIGDVRAPELEEFKGFFFVGSCFSNRASLRC
jgi:hypothetical protein